MISDAVYSIVSGECRWVGREDIHVYCHAPLVERMQSHGRMGWERGPAAYCVVCPDAGLDHGNWTVAAVAIATVQRILEGEQAEAA